jgi:hypothetical protein
MSKIFKRGSLNGNPHVSLKEKNGNWKAGNCDNPRPFSQRF